MRVGDVYETKVYDNLGMTIVRYVVVRIDDSSVSLLSCHSGNVFEEDMRWMTLEDMGYVKVFSARRSTSATTCGRL